MTDPTLAEEAAIDRQVDRERERPSDKRPAWIDRCECCNGYGTDEADGAKCRRCEGTGLNLRARMTQQEGY